MGFKNKRMLTRSRSKIFSEIMYKKVSELDGKGQKLAYQHWKDDLFSMTNKGYTEIT